MKEFSQRLHSEDESHEPTLSGQDDSRLTSALEEYLAALDSGRPLLRDAFLAEHADIRAELVECLEGLEFVRDAASQTRQPTRPDGIADPPPVGRGTALGDFQIVCELGRGGMGIVYEAEQLSLGRPVAVKVLPFAALLKESQLQRFHNETRAAAMLKHPHIVSVHSVGCDRGVHYYAMELIRGQTLADLVAGHADVGDWRSGGRQHGVACYRSDTGFPDIHRSEVPIWFRSCKPASMKTRWRITPVGPPMTGMPTVTSPRATWWWHWPTANTRQDNGFMWLSSLSRHPGPGSSLALAPWHGGALGNGAITQRYLNRRLLRWFR